MTNEAFSSSVSLTSLPNAVSVISIHQGFPSLQPQNWVVGSGPIPELKGQPRAHCDLIVLEKVPETLEHSFIAVLITGGQYFYSYTFIHIIVSFSNINNSARF